MGPSLARVATTTICIMLVAACGAAPSPSPIASTSPSPRAAGSPSAPPASSTMPTPASSSTAPTAVTSGWPYAMGDAVAVLGPNGTMYLLAGNSQGAYGRIVTALDAAGHTKPGWPIEARPGSAFATLALGPDGSVFLDECGGLDVGCAIHRLGADGREVSGWPFDVPADFACPSGDQCYSSGLDVGPNGTVYVTSQRVDERRLMAIDAGGGMMPGWPLVLDGYDWSEQQLGHDGTVYLIRRPFGTPTFDPSLGVIDEGAALVAFGPNGKPRSGWPVPVPNIGRYLIGPDSDVVVWSLLNDVGELCSSPRRTLFTVLGPDGRISSGWPRGSTGFASFPTLGPDGTLYYVSATHKLYAHDRSGEVMPGWPVAVSGAGGGCGPESPLVAPDGTIYTVGDEVSALSPDGRPLAGWPYRPAAGMIGPCFDTECYGGHAPPVVAADGSVYLVVYPSDPSGVRAEVLAIDRRGQLKPGWPYRLPFDANNVAVGIAGLSADGQLFVRGGDQLLALDPDGRLSR